MAYIGSCPDMCPEKERQARYGLHMSIFERDQNNEPDVHAMVKEYRRSGADQEEPAPEDLRTPEALELTLDYLVNNIMDDQRSKTLELDWYDFLWDRLRAIRKDITQQNICDQASAMLVERCTRFHVHCCYSMNQVKDFDVDMNKKTVNDCLQMLRQMYSDLKVSTGSVCGSELEFQKYDILLHLNQDHLSSTLQMKMSDYISSEEMKFIIKVFSACTNNDYYRFFRAMERADYMTSCVLSLHANKIRLNGFKTIINACATRQSTLYPAELLIKSLGFDDQDDLRNFASNIGIEAQFKDGRLHLVFNKDLLPMLRASETSMAPFKSKRLVEDKKQGSSIGRLVYGQEGFSTSPARTPTCNLATPPPPPPPPPLNLPQPISAPVVDSPAHVVQHSGVVVTGPPELELINGNKDKENLSEDDDLHHVEDEEQIEEQQMLMLKRVRSPETMKRDMPAGFFKVGSLSSRVPKLCAPKETASPTVFSLGKLTRESDTHQHKRLKAADWCIQEEKDFNTAIVQITKLYTFQ